MKLHVFVKGRVQGVGFRYFVQRRAEELGLDVDAFTRTLDSGDKRTQIEENLKLAAAAGIERVPAVMVNGMKIEGRQPLETYIQAIEAQLRAGKQ